MPTTLGSGTQLDKERQLDKLIEVIGEAMNHVVEVKSVTRSAHDNDVLSTNAAFEAAQKADTALERAKAIALKIKRG